MADQYPGARVRWGVFLVKSNNGNIYNTWHRDSVEGEYICSWGGDETRVAQGLATEDRHRHPEGLYLVLQAPDDSATPDPTSSEAAELLRKCEFCGKYRYGINCNDTTHAWVEERNRVVNFLRRHGKKAEELADKIMADEHMPEWLRAKPDGENA